MRNARATYAYLAITVESKLGLLGILNGEEDKMNIVRDIEKHCINPTLIKTFARAGIYTQLSCLLLSDEETPRLRKTVIGILAKVALDDRGPEALRVSGAIAPLKAIAAGTAKNDEEMRMIYLARLTLKEALYTEEYPSRPQRNLAVQAQRGLAQGWNKLRGLFR